MTARSKEQADLYVVVDEAAAVLRSAVALAIEHLDLARRQTGWREEHIAAAREVLEAALHEGWGQR